MSNSAIQKELEALRQQVAELNRERDTEEVAQLAPGLSGASDQKQSFESVENGQIEDQDSEGLKFDIEEQIQEFIDVLEVEMKETNPVTVLVIFSLGLLIGRLLPR